MDWTDHRLAFLIKTEKEHKVVGCSAILTFIYLFIYIFCIISMDIYLHLFYFFNN